jgi:hypothetical protein
VVHAASGKERFREVLRFERRQNHRATLLNAALALMVSDFRGLTSEVKRPLVSCSYLRILVEDI